VAVYDDIFADIGDEQSIQASLSTFSAHLRNLSEILRSATDRSLVLVDELGSGTDPVEGAALGGAILEELTSRRTLTVATTHLGDLKLLAGANTAVVNASLQFDEIRLAPTYRLIKGIPGRSYGLSIARRLQLPKAVLDGAEQRLPRAERDMAVLLGELERREAELADRERESREALENARAREARVAERELAMRTAERGLERRAKDTTREYLLEARAGVEQVIRELRQASAGEVERVAREARRHVEQRAAEAAQASEALAAEENTEAEHGRTVGAGGEPAVGDMVTVGSFGGREARVVELRGDDATVALGGLKLTVPRGDLRVRRTREELRAAAVPIAELPEIAAPTDLDLRGLRVDEIEPILLQALDAANRADQRELRIIHGKGTGALRERVAEMLRADARIRAFRLGAFNEGGTGVTVAEFA
jgi:DNA mismatch repair protein MutS2